MKSERPAYYIQYSLYSHSKDHSTRCKYFTTLFQATCLWAWDFALHNLDVSFYSVKAMIFPIPKDCSSNCHNDQGQQTQRGCPASQGERTWRIPGRQSSLLHQKIGVSKWHITQWASTSLIKKNSVQCDVIKSQKIWESGFSLSFQEMLLRRTCWGMEFSLQEIFSIVGHPFVTLVWNPL